MNTSSSVFESKKNENDKENKTQREEEKKTHFQSVGIDFGHLAESELAPLFQRRRILFVVIFIVSLDSFLGEFLQGKHRFLRSGQREDLIHSFVDF
jgi:hypothetical protein